MNVRTRPWIFVLDFENLSDNVVAILETAQTNTLFRRYYN